MRDHVLAHRTDYPGVRAGFAWPQLETFNFATDWFDGLVAIQPNGRALWIVDEPGEPGVTRTFAELYTESVAAAHWLAEHGVGHGSRILLMLHNCVPIWQLMLGALRLGAVVIPATPLLFPDDVRDRLDRGKVDLVITHTADTAKFDGLRTDAVLAVVEPTAPEGWVGYDLTPFDGRPDEFEPGTAAGDQQLLYFTSGTTAQPKLVEHTAVSYPVGHLSTLTWMGIQPGDVHLNISSPGWGKDAWSNFFGPWLAGAMVRVSNYVRFDARGLLAVLQQTRATTFCAPPTVWRMLVQAKLDEHEVFLRECLSAGEPLNPEIIAVVERAWGLTIRDGYGQTETTCSVGNPPGHPVKPGAMGVPMPGYDVVLVDPATGEVRQDEGELCLPLDPRPLALTPGYRDTADDMDDELTASAMHDGLYHSGDVVSRDADGYLTYVGRADDVFKASDYKISPFELESVLIEHPAVAEAAIVPSPDPLRLAVPKAYIVLANGFEESAEVARGIIAHVAAHVAPFAVPPKPISGKIGRVELRAREARDINGDQVPRLPDEYWASDFGL